MSQILGRHGLTEWNKLKKIQGWRNSDLIDRGKNQAKLTGELLLDDLWFPDEIKSSDLGRTRQTAKIIANVIGFAPDRIEFLPGMREISFGKLEGKTKQERDSDEFKEIQEGRQLDKYGYIIPGGESYEIVEARVREVLKTINFDINTLLIGHEAVNRMILKILGNLDTEEALYISQPNNFLYKIDGTKIYNRDVEDVNGEWKQGLLMK